MKVYCTNVDLLSCKSYNSKTHGTRTYGKVYENGRLYDFCSDGVIEDVRDVDAVFDFRFGIKEGKPWTMLYLQEMKKN